MSTATPNMALQRTRRPRFRSGRSPCSLGSPLNAYSFGGPFRILATASVLAALGCATQGRVEGIVKDEFGGRLPGTVVKLESIETKRMVVTDLRGRFSFSRIPPGTYSLSLELVSFQKPLPRNLVVSRRGRQFLDLVLTLPPPQPVTVGEGPHFFPSPEALRALGTLPLARTLVEFVRSAYE